MLVVMLLSPVQQWRQLLLRVLRCLDFGHALPKMVLFENGEEDEITANEAKLLMAHRTAFGISSRSRWGRRIPLKWSSSTFLTAPDLTPYKISKVLDSKIAHWCWCPKNEWWQDGWRSLQGQYRYQSLQAFNCFAIIHLSYFHFSSRSIISFSAEIVSSEMEVTWEATSPESFLAFFIDVNGSNTAV